MQSLISKKIINSAAQCNASGTAMPVYACSINDNSFVVSLLPIALLGCYL